ncbi:peptidoglycan -binding protein [Rubellimicrobium aerolatum]|uniref:Peptidoglycan -binding protein n=1 Tax=Rubellimicrobium aerolatum TaxID=490979 RepID=A0ABW0SEB3_9RHOB|nr:peptidoglycan -binding protein [Rubellimicrobium aerolatum]MBP1805732.1 chemotaxis protein MotB [Rubellimicrobium aerolatum]
MLRARRRSQPNTWPGFVDAMTGLLLVLMFVLTIFTVVQFTLRDQITGQQTRLDDLAAQVASLTDALGLSQSREASLSRDLSAVTQQGREQADLINRLTRERDSRAADLAQAQTRITDVEARVAALLLERDEAQGRAATLDQALASARTEIDAATEAARLAAARREALEQLVRSLNTAAATGAETLADTRDQLSESERQRLAEAAAAQALRDRLADSEAELTAMTLSLEEERQKAEETLTLLAAAQSARDDLDLQLAAALLARQQAEERATAAEAQGATLDARLAEALAAQEAARQALDAARTADADRDDLSRRLAEAVLSQERAEATAQEAQATEADLRARLAAALDRATAAESQGQDALTESERQAALLATAQAQLREQEALSTEGQRQVAALNEQVAELRSQVATLQTLLDVAAEADREAQVRIESLGADLNTALARVAAEERRRAALEAEEAARARAEAARLAAEARDLESYRSEFFGNMRRLLEGREGIQVVGDRFVFSSEVLFEPGRAQLSPEGQAQIASVADLLREIAAEIPPGIDWVIQVDGHTDDTPLAGTGTFRDNWELSQGRALSVVRQMSEAEGIPPDRLSANGFGEYQPLDTSGTPESRARNRRIEIKLTER